MATNNSKHDQVVEYSRRQAETYMAKGNWKRSFAHFLVVLKLRPELRTELKLDLAYVLREIGEQLESSHRFNDLFKCYEQALEVYPDCEQVNNNLGAHLFRLGQVEEATVYFWKALLLNPNFTAAKENLENAYNALVERWHFPMLNDRRRNKAFESAIHRAIKKGCSTVLDVGAGTGLLSMYAVEGGAKDIYACEMSKTMFAVSCDILKANEMQDQVKLFNLHSSDLEIPTHITERVSLLVTETVDAGLLGERILETLHHAWQHYLILPNDQNNSCGSRIIPAKATVWICLVECEAMRKQIRMQGNEIGPLKLMDSMLMSFPDSELYTTEKLDNVPGGVSLLSAAIKALNFNFCDPQEIENCLKGFDVNLEISCIESGILDAVAMWFDLHLDEQDSISTMVDTCWEQALFPVYSECPISVVAGDVVTVKTTVYSDHLNFQCKNIIRSDLVTVDISLVDCGLSKQQILNLNNADYWTALTHSLEKLIKSESSLLDISSVPIGGLLALKLGAKHVTIASSSLDDMMKETAFKNNIPNDTFEFIDGNNLHDNSKNWDVVIMDIIESNGLLKQEVIENISLLRQTSLKNSYLIPKEIVVYTVPIESDYLLKQSKVINDEDLGFIIGKYLNTFQVTTHLDITLSVLPHQRLSDPVQLLRIPFGNEDFSDKSLNAFEISNSVVIKITKSGYIHALPFWFKIHLTDDDIISTNDKDFYWKQAAIILKEAIHVSKHQQLLIKGICKNSNINIECSVVN